MLCTKGLKLEVLQSAAGYYIGTLEDEEPYCRLSDCYFKSKEMAQAALDTLSFPVRYNSVEIEFCNGGNCILAGKQEVA